MTTIQIYKKISKLITELKDDFISLHDAENEFDNLFKLGKGKGIDLHVDSGVLEWINLTKFDDEIKDIEVNG